jgi:hypothetical protein
MRRRVRDKLIDNVMDAYVDWRQESAQVDYAYWRWTVAGSTDADGAFDVFAAALDREELASICYAHIIRRTTVVLARDRRRRVATAQHHGTRRRLRRRQRRTAALPRGSRVAATRSTRRARS